MFCISIFKLLIKINNQLSSCIDLGCAPTELHLNASALSSDSLYISLSSPAFPKLRLNTLLDFGSSHCFVDVGVAQKYSLPLRSITPIPLCLFDGSSNCKIQFTVDLSVTFPCGNSMTVCFYVTTLDSLASAVLGYN